MEASQNKCIKRKAQRWCSVSNPDLFSRLPYKFPSSWGFDLICFLYWIQCRAADYGKYWNCILLLLDKWTMTKIHSECQLWTVFISCACTWGYSVIFILPPHRSWGQLFHNISCTESFHRRHHQSILFESVGVHFPVSMRYCQRRLQTDLYNERCPFQHMVGNLVHTHWKYGARSRRRSENSGYQQKERVM